MLRLAFFGDLEIGGLQVRDRRTRLVCDDDVDPDEVDAGAKDRRLLTGGRLIARGSLAWRLRGLLLRLRRLLLRLLGVAAHRAQGERE